MTNTASALGLGPGAGIAPLRAKWGWIVALGVVYLVAGVIALGSVVQATAAAVWVVGIMMIIAGVFEVIHSFQIKTWGRFLFWLLLGVLYIIAGLIAFENTLLTAIWLTLLLGAALVASGIVRIFLGFERAGRNPMGLGRRLGPDHAAIRDRHSHPLAVFGPVRARNYPRCRLGIRWCGLDWPRHGPSPSRLNAEVRHSARSDSLGGEGSSAAGSRDKEAAPVRWLYLAIVVVFVAALIIFIFQNTQSVDVSFLSARGNVAGRDSGACGLCARGLERRQPVRPSAPLGCRVAARRLGSSDHARHGAARQPIERSVMQERPEPEPGPGESASGSRPAASAAPTCTWSTASCRIRAAHRPRP